MLIVLSTVLIEMKRGRVLGQRVPSYSEDTFNYSLYVQFNQIFI